MSTNGTRKSTHGWGVGSDRPIGPGDDIVVIDEEPEKPLPPATAKSEILPGPPPPPLRPRSSTLEISDEMVVLDRPLGGGIGAIAAKPRGRWRQVAALISTAAIVGGGGVFLLSRHHAAAALPAEHTEGAPQGQARPKPALAAQSRPALGAANEPSVAAPGARAANDDSGGDDAEEAPGPAGIPGKVTSEASRGGHSKHTGSKTHHRATKHTVAAKRGKHHH